MLQKFQEKFLIIEREKFSKIGWKKDRSVGCLRKNPPHTRPPALIASARNFRMKLPRPSSRSLRRASRPTTGRPTTGAMRSSTARAGRPCGPRRKIGKGCERSVRIKLKIKKTYFENKSNTILKIKDLASKIK